MSDRSGPPSSEGEGDDLRPTAEDRDSSEESSEEDPEEARRIAEGFIQDDDDDDDDEDPEARRERKRREKRHRRRKERKAREAEAAELSEDELELLQENRGLGRSRDDRPYKRLKRRSGSPDEGRSALQDMFRDDEGRAAIDSDDDMEDFIEEDEEEEAAKGETEADRRERKRQEKLAAREAARARPGEAAGVDRGSWDEIYAVFGDGKDYDWVDEADEEGYDEEELAGKKDLRLEDVFDPAEIKARRLKDEDRAIAQADKPERYQLVNSTLSDNPIIASDTLFPPPTIAGYSLYARISLRTQYIFCNMHAEGSYPAPDSHAYAGPAQRRPDLINDFIKAVAAALDMMFIQNLEVPTLWHYKRDRFSVLENRGRDQVQFLDRDELWTLFHLGTKFRAIHNRNGQITDTWARIKAAKPDLQNDYLETTLLGSVCMSSIEAAADGYNWLCYHYPDEVRQIKEEDVMEGSKRHFPERSVNDERRSGPIMKFVKEFGIEVADVAVKFAETGDPAPTKSSERMPEELAEEFTGAYFATAEDVIEAAKSVLVIEFSKDPTIRQEGRRWLESSASITVTPTERGMTVIDKYHLYWTFKFLTNKPVDEFKNDPQFLHMLRAEEEGLIKISVHVPDDSLEMFSDALYRCVEAKDYGTVATAWNKLRKEIVDKLVRDHLLPTGSKYLREQMKTEAEDYVAKHCAQQLEYRINVRPFAAGHMEPGGTPKVISITNGRGDIKDAVMAAVVDDDGKVKLQTKFDNLKDEADRMSFIELVEKYKPNVIVIGGMSVHTARLREDAYAAVKTVACRTIGESPPNVEGYPDHSDAYGEAVRAHEERIKPYLIPLIYVPDDTARQYMLNEESAQEFPATPQNGRYAIALARYAQNPLNAYCKLGKEIASVTFMEHHQKLISQEKLLVHLERALVNAVCSMGIEINSCIADPYQRVMLPFIAGLGPRKADALVNAVNKSGNVINRLAFSDLFGPTILENVSGFLSINNDVADMVLEKEEPESQPDPLDLTRIHPEHYEFARKMCENALDLDAEDVADQHPSEVVVQLMNLDAKEKRRRIDALSLDDYAVQLEPEKGILKHVLLEIVEELLYYRRDLRPDFAPLEPWDVVKMLTGETQRTLGPGCLVSATVRRVFATRIICELPAGIEALLDKEEIDGSMDEKMIQDKFQRGATFKAAIKDFNPVRMAAQLTVSDLAYAYDYVNPFIEDRFNDRIRQSAAEEEAALRKRRKAGTVKRVVHHPNWHTMNSGQAELYLAPLQRGDVVVRPSSKGPDHLAVTWKVDDDVYQHIDVMEIDKPNEYTIGRILRVAGKYSYSDLDDLIINHVKAMARKFDEMQNHEKYRPEDELESYLKNYVQAHPGRSMYGFSVDSNRPGYLKLCFLNRSTKDGGVIQEWPVKVLPGAYMLNNAEVPGVTELCNAFKMQYSNKLADQGSGGKTPGIRAGKTPMGGRTPGGRTPGGVMRGGQTPMQGMPGMPGMVPGYRQTPMRPGMTPNVYNQVPFGGATPAGGRPPFPPTAGFARPPPPPGGFGGPPPPPPGAYGAHPPPPGVGGPQQTLGMNPERAAMIAREGR